MYTLKVSINFVAYFTFHVSKFKFMIKDQTKNKRCGRKWMLSNTSHLLKSKAYSKQSKHALEARSTWWDQDGGVCEKNGTSLHGEVRFPVHELELMFQLGKGDLDHRARSNTICWCVCNLCLMWWSKLLSWELKTSFGDEKNDGQTRGNLIEDAKWVHWVKMKTHLVKPPTLKT
jgi:hypothetical protein